MVCDWQDLEVGNLRRHTLTITDVPHDKSLMLAFHLNQCSPFADVQWAGNFPNHLGAERERIRRADIIIDCTASDDVAARLATFTWDDDSRWFFSGSLGVNARRLFCYTHFGTTFPTRECFDAMQPFVAEERALLQQLDPLTLHSAGCWNPVFPARWDDIMALAARMLRIVDATLATGDANGALHVVDRPTWCTFWIDMATRSSRYPISSLSACGR